jgi:branched-chain amino acid transport system permease protein
MKQSLFNKKNLTWLVIAVVVFVVVQLLINARIISPYYRVTLFWICIFAILGVSLNIIIGVTGQFSLGHAGFMSIGAYSAAVLLKMMPNYTGLAIGIVVGLIISFVISFIVAMPTLRLKGDYLAIATLGVGEIIRIIILNMTITNGASGISNIPFLINWPLMFVFTVLAIALSANFKNSAIGRACISIKEDEIASEAMGINTTKYKVTAFVFGALLASVAGALYATSYYVIKPETFGITNSINILVIVVFGGMGSLTGSVVAAIVLGIINIVLQPLAELRMIIYALALIGIMIFRPQGLLGTYEASLSSLFNFKSHFKRFTKAGKEKA